MVNLVTEQRSVSAYSVHGWSSVGGGSTPTGRPTVANLVTEQRSVSVYSVHGWSCSVVGSGAE